MFTGIVEELGQVRAVMPRSGGARIEIACEEVISDAARGKEPWLVVTGDSLFVGDVARPDLAVEPEEGARELFGSLNRLLELDDFAEAWPGHIGGSLCGGAGMLLSFYFDISSAATIVLTSAGIFILLEIVLLMRKREPRFS